MSEYSSEKDRRAAWYILLAVITVSVAYFMPRTLQEVAIDRAKSCSSCLDSRSAIVTQVEYSSGSAAGYGTSDWVNASYTFESADGEVFHHEHILDGRFEENQHVTLRLYKSDLMFVDRSYAHQAWGGIETLLFLPLPFAVVGLVLLWYSRPSQTRSNLYRRGYILLTGIVGLFAGVLFIGGLRLVWWPLPVLLMSAGVPTLVLGLRRRKHT